MPELRNCPICNGAAEHKVMLFGTLPNYYVSCSLCALQTTLYNSEEVATASWNSRHSDKELDILRQRVAQLEKHKKSADVFLSALKEENMDNA